MIRLKPDYYVPRTKYELIQWFVKHLNYTKSSLQSFPHKKLLAIYHKVRSKQCIFVRKPEPEDVYEDIYQLSS